MRWQKSQELYEEVKKFIPRGSMFIDRGLSLSKQHMRGEYPIYFKRGEGSHLISLDDEEYIDYASAGAIILGYNYPAVMKRVKEVLENGAFSMQSPLMAELARELTQIIPGVGMMYFCKTGSDATTAAVRVARCYTGKEKIVRCPEHYYGWHDWCRVGERGVPKVLSEYTLGVPFNDLESLEGLLKEKGGEIACFIFEPMRPPIGVLRMPKGYSALPKPGYLEGLRDLTKRYNVVLIFDECKLCFRLALGGVREYYGVIPDISTYGKGMANGFPMAAVLGTREIMESMEQDSYKATLGEEAVGMAAALALINEERRKNVIGHIRDLGRQLMEGLDDVAEDLDVEAKCTGLPAMFSFFFDLGESEANRRLEETYFQECLRRGIYIGLRGFWYVYYTHSREDIHKTLEVCRDALKIAKKKVPRS